MIGSCWRFEHRAHVSISGGFGKNKVMSAFCVSVRGVL